MGGRWYAPLSFREWAARTFSFLNLLILMVTLLLGAAEFRFDWLEKQIGAYLASMNQARPETGAVWEAGRHSASATQSLNKIIRLQEKSQRAQLGARSFFQLMSGLGPGQWVTLDKARFRSLYLDLPVVTRRQILAPARLIWLLNTAVVDRIFCEGSVAGVGIYFIDSANRVIQEIQLDKARLSRMQSEGGAVAGTLAQMPGFSGRIYPAARFFDAMFRLSSDMQADLIRDPERLLQQDGVIRQVGIWNEARDGTMTLGFEFLSQGHARVIQVQAREWAVWELTRILKGAAQ